MSVCVGDRPDVVGKRHEGSLLAWCARAAFVLNHWGPEQPRIACPSPAAVQSNPRDGKPRCAECRGALRRRDEKARVNSLARASADLDQSSSGFRRAVELLLSLGVLVWDWKPLLYIATEHPHGAMRRWTMWGTSVIMRKIMRKIFCEIS